MDVWKNQIELCAYLRGMRRCCGATHKYTRRAHSHPAVRVEEEAGLGSRLRARDRVVSRQGVRTCHVQTN